MRFFRLPAASAFRRKREGGEGKWGEHLDWLALIVVHARLTGRRALSPAPS